MTRVDVAIIGAGTAGLTCAVVLARAGCDVAVYEAKPRLDRSVCGEYLCPAGVTTATELGFGELLRSTPPVKGMRLVSPAGRVVRCFFPRDGRHGWGVSLDKLEFHRGIARELEGHGGSIEFGSRVRAVTRNANGWNVEFAGARGSVDCSVLIGADGRRSVVAKAAGLLRPEPASRRIAVRGFVDMREEPERLGEMHLLPGGAYLGVNPIARDEINVSLVADADRLDELGGHREAMQNLAARAPDLQRFDWSTLRDLKGITPIRSSVRAATGDRLALIGDASGFVDPLTGEGISIALWSGGTAGQLLVDALQGRSDVATQLRRYGQQRRRAFRAKSMVSRGFQSIIRRPWLCEAIGRYLAEAEHRAEALIGVVGNNYTPAEGALAWSGVRPNDRRASRVGHTSL